MAYVTPLQKKLSLDRNILKNYRPVSNLSFISKLIEKVVAKQLNEFISLEGLLNVNQSAYKSSHSTETALLKIQNDIVLSVDSGKAVTLTLLDLSAAFDTFDHSPLYDCLHDWFGLDGTVLSWIKSISYILWLSISSTRPKKHIGRCGFAVAAPAEWNKLPQTVRSQQTIDGFRSQVKTYLFRLAYPPP